MCVWRGGGGGGEYTTGDGGCMYVYVPIHGGGEGGIEFLRRAVSLYMGKGVGGWGSEKQDTKGNEVEAVTQ